MIELSTANISLFILTLITLIIASYTDIKRREVPDMISYGFIFLALLLRATFAIDYGWQFLVSGLVGFIICLVIASVLFFSGQWGGADSKLLLGMGVVLGTDFIFGTSSNINLAWGLALFFLLLLLVSAIYGLVWMLVLAFIKRKNFIISFKSKIKQNKVEHFVALGFTILFLILTFWQVFFLVLAIIPLLGYYLFIFVASVEETCFIQARKIPFLVEGDWLAEDVYVMKENLGRKELVVEKKVIDRKDLNHLRQLYSEGQLTEIKIKEGLPLVPGFLFAYLVLMFFWEWLSSVLF
ncbi:hypothetical protein HN385_02870 [archaeon]|nr:hypothetical protein [archaeon]MBT3450569.1 hypothetical protein [archaeon]MBT6868423.1 hypothetical protein [archaeon]MBT7381283.1 hypothetical protein [archaeon]